jgi:glycerate 2-kinase
MGYIKNYDTLASNDNRKVVLELAEAAFASVAPNEVFKQNLSLIDNVLKIQNKSYDLTQFDRVMLLGFGKGSAGNAKRIEETLGDRLTDGFVNDVVEDEHFQKIHYTKGTHPLPSQENFTFTNNAIEHFENITEKDLVIVITCGGGSVLFEAPRELSLDQMISVNKALLDSGANITEMNIVRKHLSKVKGGGLAKILYPATVVNLIFSDVPGNDLTVIASGPLVKDPTNLADAKGVYDKYHLEKSGVFTPDDFVETPKEDKYYEKVSNILMLSNLTALNAMEKLAREKGYTVHVMSDRLQGDAHTLGKQLIDETGAGEILIAGGESTIKITGHGKGGRNQALVLSQLETLPDNVVLASFGSDGWDFYELAGAIADTDTKKKAEEMNLDPKTFLDDDNSYEFWDKTGDGIRTGHLDSNVSDLYIVLKTK